MSKFSKIFSIKTNGHADLDFVDIIPTTDIRLFIDPTLIEKSDDTKSLEAALVIDDYSKELFNALKSHDIKKLQYLFLHAHEKNETHLGYCKKMLYGKGKTPEGLSESVSSLQTLFDNNVNLKTASEIPIFTKRFAEDCMSDLLTNLLSKELYLFTIEKASEYNLPLSNKKFGHHFWNTQTHQWDYFEGKQLINPDDGKPLFLTPKNWVRNCYYVNVNEYIRNIILTKMQNDDITYSNEGKIIKRPKKEYSQKVRRQHNNSFDICRSMTIKNPELLDKHRTFLKQKKEGLFMTDDQLDEIVEKTLNEKFQNLSN